MHIEIVTVDAPWQILRQRGVITAGAEVAHDENSKGARIDRLRFEAFARRNTQRNFRALISHRSGPRYSSGLRRAIRVTQWRDGYAHAKVLRYRPCGNSNPYSGPKAFCSARSISRCRIDIWKIC